MCEYCLKSPHDCRCPNAQIEFIGNCAECGEPISTAYEYYIDNENNLFCREECAIAYHGIKYV